jgi:hypothetical protein
MDAATRTQVIRGLESSAKIIKGGVDFREWVTVGDPSLAQVSP